jgi:hypothetical protein
VFVSGFWMTAFLQCLKSKTTPGALTLACFTKVKAAKMTKAVPWSETAAVAFSCSMEVGKAATFPTTFIVEGLKRWGCICTNTLSASAASFTALVAPHLEDGQLKGKITFSSMDLLYRLA